MPSLGGTHHTSLDNSRTMKEKSHRASRGCYRSGVGTLHGTRTRRLDGYRLYSASDLQRRRLRKGGRRPLRCALCQLRWRRGVAQGDRHPARADQAVGRLPGGRPPAGQGPASDRRVAPPAGLRPGLRLRRLQRTGSRTTRSTNSWWTGIRSPDRPWPRSPRSRGSRTPWAGGSCSRWGMSWPTP